MNWYKPPGAAKYEKRHCAACFEPDDHTMFWCVNCNLHLHRCHTLTPAGGTFDSHEEAEAQYQSSGFRCHKCSEKLGPLT